MGIRSLSPSPPSLSNKKIMLGQKRHMEEAKEKVAEKAKKPMIQTVTSSNALYEEELTNLFKHGGHLKVRMKHTKDLRLFQLYKSELKATQLEMNRIVKYAGWSKEYLKDLMPIMGKKCNDSINQLNHELRMKAFQNRKPPPGPRDQRIAPPVSPLARGHAKVQASRIAKRVPKVFDFEETPKREIQPERRTIPSNVNCEGFAPKSPVYLLAGMTGLVVLMISIGIALM